VEDPRTDLEDETIAAFRARYGYAPAIVASAPGRVNLIGEHTDYNEGFVLPMAIDRAVAVAAAQRPDRLLRMYAENIQDSVSAPLDDLYPSSRSTWSNYVKGVASQLERAGDRLPGMDLCIRGNIPRGAGLSSSAAIELASALAFQAAGGHHRPLLHLARLCQRAENEFVGIRCGIMDQLVSAVAREGHAALIDCRTLLVEFVPFPAGAVILVFDSGVRRALADSAYNARHDECAAAAAAIAKEVPGVTALRDVTRAAFDAAGATLEPTLRKRARHVVSEDDRVLQAVAALKSSNLDRTGKLMYESHMSLRDDFEVSTPELDAIVDLAATCEGVFGARMTGAGFGGSAITLVSAGNADAVGTCVAAKYRHRTGKSIPALACRPAPGARVRTLP
jgi:galactokinase